jgi:hypothetical protein
LRSARFGKEYQPEPVIAKIFLSMARASQVGQAVLASPPALN